jgi:hypothetical protein
MQLRVTKARVAVAGALLALGGVGAGLATAQSSAPTVTVHASPTAVSIDATGPLPAGPTRFNFVRPAAKTTLDAALGRERTGAGWALAAVAAGVAGSTLLLRDWERPAPADEAPAAEARAEATPAREHANA